MASVWSDIEPYGKILTLCGALVIFFSWVVNNTIQERLKDSAAAASGLRDSFELFEALRGLAGSIESLAGIALNVSGDVTGVIEMMRPPRDATDRDRSTHDRNLTELAARRLNARQIDAGIAFGELTLRTAGRRSADTVELQHVLREMTSARTRKEEMFAIAEAALNKGSDWRSPLSDLPALLDSYGEQLIRAVAYVAALVDRRGTEVDRLRRYANLAGRLALTLYALGSLLALTGTAATEL